MIPIQFSIGEILTLIVIVLSALVLIATCYTPLINYVRRPNLILIPWIWGRRNERIIGLKVQNSGRSIAKGTYGVFECDNQQKTVIQTVIQWNDSAITHVDIYPGPMQECWFHIAKLRKSASLISRFIGHFGTVKEYCEIKVRLFWEYYGLRSLTARFALDLKSWDSAGLTVLKNCVGSS